jgi:hypothetical protein
MVGSHVLFAPSAAANVPLTCLTNLHRGTNWPQHGWRNIRLEILAWYEQLTCYEKRQKMEANAYCTIVICVRYGRQ